MTALIGALTSATLSSLTDGRAFSKLDRYTDHSGNDWVFVLASIAITQYDTVAIKANGNAAPITEALSKSNHQIGFAQVAFTAGDHGWVMARGNPTIRAAASCAVAVALYITATAGVLDDAVTSQMIQGVVLGSAASAGGVSAVGAVAAYPTVRRAATL